AEVGPDPEVSQWHSAAGVGQQPGPERDGGGRFPGAPDAGTVAAHVPLTVIGAVPVGVPPPFVVQVDGVVGRVRVPPKVSLDHPVLARCVAVRPTGAELARFGLATGAP